MTDTKVFSIGDHLSPISAETPAESKASSLKLHRIPQKNVMPGVAEDGTEYDTIAKFYGATSPSNLKWKMFEFIRMAQVGELTIEFAETE